MKSNFRRIRYQLEETMTKREKIARAAAKEAALATYKAVLSAPVKKIASISKGVQTVIDVKAVAKTAAASAYNAITRLAQDPQSIPTPDTIERTLDSNGFGVLGNLLRGAQVDLIEVEAALARLKGSTVLTEAQKATVIAAAKQAGAIV